jgi:probable rRNA maturation factor
LRVHIVSRGVRHSIPKRLLARVAAAAMRTTGCAGGAELEVALTNNATIARINRVFLGHRGPTDVITFPGGPHDRVIGEVVISVEQARRQARQARWPVRREVALLLAHGVLHLGGWDDHTPQGAAEMRRLERLILRRVLGSSTITDAA